MKSERFCQFAQFKLLNFAGRRFGEVLEDDLFGRFETGKPFAGERDDGCFVCRSPVFELDERARHFAPCLIRFGHDGT